MNIALLIIYILTAINLLITSNRHGTPKEENFNFWETLIVSLITLILIWWALGWKFI
ncbi:MAG: hypothetical protein AABY22_31815 [Nanoarchaeota archaeon]